MNRGRPECCLHATVLLALPQVKCLFADSAAAQRAATASLAAVPFRPFAVSAAHALVMQTEFARQASHSKVRCWLSALVFCCVLCVWVWARRWGGAVSAALSRWCVRDPGGCDSRLPRSLLALGCQAGRRRCAPCPPHPCPASTPLQAVAADLRRHYAAAALGMGAFFAEDLAQDTGFGGFLHAGELERPRWAGSAAGAHVHTTEAAPPRSAHACSLPLSLLCALHAAGTSACSCSLFSTWP